MDKTFYGVQCRCRFRTVFPRADVGNGDGIAGFARGFSARFDPRSDPAAQARLSNVAVQTPAGVQAVAVVSPRRSDRSRWWAAAALWHRTRWPFSLCRWFCGARRWGSVGPSAMVHARSSFGRTRDQSRRILSPTITTLDRRSSLWFGLPERTKPRSIGRLSLGRTSALWSASGRP